MSQGHCSIKLQDNFLGKVRIIIQQCHVKKYIKELKGTWRKLLTKNSLFLQLRILHESTVPTGSITNYYKNYFSNTSKDKHCVKSVRIRSYSSPNSVRIRENMDQNNSVYEHFLRSEVVLHFRWLMSLRTTYLLSHLDVLTTFVYHSLS